MSKDTKETSICFQTSIKRESKQILKTIRCVDYIDCMLQKWYDDTTSGHF